MLAVQPLVRPDQGRDTLVLPPGDAAAPALPPARPGALPLRACSAPDSELAALAARMAGKQGLDARALAVRTLLHLPRVASARGFVTRAQIRRELFFSAEQLRKDLNAARGLVSAAEFDLADLRFGPVPAPQADAIFSRLHYLKSGRPGALNFALIDPYNRLPITICSVSPFEWKRVGNHIRQQFGIDQGRIWDVARVYSANSAPPNAISFLLSRVRQYLRRSGQGVDLLATAVDPNLGFTGASYRAANWQHWYTVTYRPYLYVDRRYASLRQLRLEFGTSSLPELQAGYPGRRFEQSRAKLQDSKIFCCRLTGETEAVPVHRLHR